LKTYKINIIILETISGAAAWPLIDDNPLPPKLTSSVIYQMKGLVIGIMELPGARIGYYWVWGQLTLSQPYHIRSDSKTFSSEKISGQWISGYKYI